MAVSLCVGQWVVGPAYFVEFTIVETAWSKKAARGDAKDCPPMDCQPTVSFTQVHEQRELQKILDVDSLGRLMKAEWMPF